MPGIFLCIQVKDDNKDHILISEVESGKDAKSKTNKQFSRGDELLSVNGEHLAGKKLKDIHGLLFKSKKVEIKIQSILNGRQYQGNELNCKFHFMKVMVMFRKLECR